MAQELGTGYIIISPSTKGLGKAIEGDISSSAEKGADGASKTLLQRVGGAFGKIGKIGVAATAAVGGALVGLAAKGGFDRALNIERAQTKLKALGHDTRSVDGIMNDALASVKGTAFGLGDAASVAAGLVASGVKQGGQLQTVLKTVGDTAQIAGVEFKDMGTIFGKVAATGRLQGDEMLQLMEAGIPVLQYLADHFHVTAEEAQKMVSDGKVSFADFEAAMREHVGGAALSAGESFDGAMANVKAALSRLGESVATPVIKGLTGLFNQAIPLIDGFTAAAKPMLEHIGDSLQHGLEQVIPAIGGVVSTIGSMLDGLRRGLGGAFSTLGDALHPAANKIKNTFLTLFAGIKNQVDGDVGGMTDGIGVKVQGLAAKIAPALGDVAMRAAEAFQRLMPSVQDIIDRAGAAFDVLKGVLSSAKDAVEGFFDAFAQAGGSTETLSQLGGILSGLTGPLGLATLLFDQFGGAIQQIASDVMPALGSTLGSLAGTLASGIAAVLPSIVSAIESLAPIIGQVLDAGMQVVTALLPPLSSLMEGLTPIIATIAAAIGDVAGIISGTISAVLPSITDILTTLGNVLAGVIAAILPSVNSVLQALLPTLNNLLSAGSQIVQAVLPVVASLLQTLAPYIVQIADFIGQLAAMLAPLIAQLVDSLLPVITQIIETVMSIVETVMPLLTPVLDLIMVGIQTLLPVIQMVLTVVTDVISGILTAIQWIMEGVQNLFDFVAPVISAISAHVSGVIQTLGVIWNAIWTGICTVFTTVWNTIRTVVSTVLGGIHAFISSTINAIKAVWTGVWNSISAVISAVWNGIKSVVSGAINAVRATISSVLNAIKAIWDGMWNGIRNGIGAIWNGIKTGVSNGISAVMNTVRGIKDSILGFFSGAGSWLIESGRSILNGLKDGIMSGVNAVKDAVGGAIQSIRNLFPFSPAKEGPFSGHGWVLYSGMSIMEAMGDGIRARTKSAVNEASKSAHSIYDALNTGKPLVGIDVDAALNSARQRFAAEFMPTASTMDARNITYNIQIDGARVASDERLLRLLDELVDAVGATVKAR